MERLWKKVYGEGEGEGDEGTKPGRFQSFL